MLSIIIPSRNEIFLKKTTEDVLAKAKGKIEVLVVLEGYWLTREETIDDPRVHYIHHGVPKGLRGAVTSTIALAKGKHVMKIDAHCMFSEGYDIELVKSCKSHYVVIPRRYGLDAEKWQIEERSDKKYPIDHLYIECPTDRNSGDLRGAEWRSRNGSAEIGKPIEELMTFQGSCWIMEKEYFYKLELFDDKNYGTFRKEPQEISFKCWLSGGKVIRNKNAWYAHLYKGKKYKRGYSFAGGDWEKGDEYNKNWLTNSAWDKQTIDLKWLIDRFNPPGWENYDWSNYKKLEVKKDVVEKREVKKVKLYQNVGEKEGEFAWQNPKKKDSKFWNEGKWDNFIAPLLSGNCSGQTFVEVGCNAGLFLKLAKGRGFHRVVGVEKDAKVCEEGKRYRDTLGLNYALLNRTVGTDFDFDEIPVADVVLLSTVHYYFDIESWFIFLDRLQYKTRYCLLVSRSVDEDRHWQPSGEMGDIRHYFKHWQEIGAIADISTRGDPHPRELWSVMFESDLRRMDIDKIYIKNQRHRTWVEDYKKMNEAKIKLAEQIAKDDKVKMEETDYYKRWVERKKGSWSEEEIRKFVKNKMELMYDIKRNGLREPLIVKSHGQICDGGHRIAILRALGHKSVIVRMV